ncbi:MAG: RHS repeat-associated core domain-containing protein [Planctomycetaceae bacterium]
MFYSVSETLPTIWAGHHVNLDTGLTDMQARWRDTSSGVFLSEDPLSYAAGDANLYRYAFNSLGNLVDPDGRIAESVWDGASLLLGAGSLYSSITSGDVIGATIDTVGLGIDLVALAVPFVPGGAGYAIKAYRGADAVADAGRLLQSVDRVADLTRAAARTADLGVQITSTAVAYDRGDVFGTAFGVVGLGIRGYQTGPAFGRFYNNLPERRGVLRLFGDTPARRRTPNWREFEKHAFGHIPNKERFTLPWAGHSKSWGYREVDDWIPSTGTIQEATKLEWHKVEGAHATSEMWKRFTHKLAQADQDGWLLRNDPRVNQVIWYGAEYLPTTGRGAELARKLRENGIIYRVIEIP